MEPSLGPGRDRALSEGHYTVVLAGGGHRSLEATRAGPDLQLGVLGDLPAIFQRGRS